MQASPWEHDLARELLQVFQDRILHCSTYLGQNFVEVRPDAAMAIFTYLKDTAGFDAIVDITAVDYPKREARFDLIYILYSYSRNERLRVKMMVADSAEPDSAVPVWSGANWM